MNRAGSLPVLQKAESMTEPVQTVPGRLYMEIESYVSKRSREFEQISEERKAELQQLAVYVGECIAKGHDAKLTFVCTHNSRRSHLTQIWTQIAAAHYGVNHVQVSLLLQPLRAMPLSDNKPSFVNMPNDRLRVLNIQTISILLRHCRNKG